MSLAGVAAALDRDRNTDSKWLERGCPAITRGNKVTGTPWVLDIAKVAAGRPERKRPGDDARASLIHGLRVRKFA